MVTVDTRLPDIDCMKDVVVDSPERALWLSVIQQAFMDATHASRPSASNPTYESLSHHYAKIWLLNASQDFSTVCELAGLSPKYVRATAKDLLKKKESHILGEDVALQEKELIF